MSGIGLHRISEIAFEFILRKSILEVVRTVRMHKKSLIWSKWILLLSENGIQILCLKNNVYQKDFLKKIQIWYMYGFETS